MRIFYFGVLGFWLFGYGFDWWNEIGFFFFFLMINLVCFDLMNVV